MIFLVAQIASVTVDIGVVIGSIIAASVIALATMVARNNRLMHKIVFQVGSIQPPEGIIGEMHELKYEIHQLKVELQALREWAISVGFERRNYPSHTLHPYKKD